ncbi:3-alpha,7-alpha,12-alpha-trihydroxy-5-beta-cholest-24-enoyl-CoAhydratase [Burkholderia sp. H160]|nr:3-alpha,7-alpha,12-alpha-trihydroxy-5-beta-cholest-24-enoyl-CoAhydratase [Burkholderia sp. H160]
MAIDRDRLLALAIPDTAQSYSQKDTLLYALSLGYGADPLDPAQLRFAYEENLLAVPTMGVVLAHPGFWPRLLDTGLDWVRIVHAEQGLVLHKPLPAQADVIGQSRVVSVIDKGVEKGALITYERRILERDSGEPLCTITQVMLARGDGGFGGPTETAAPPPTIPERLPDRVCELPTAPHMALLYRLNGDWNSLHADPAVARKAGFERPILHGLATWGVAGHAVLRAALDYRSERVTSIFGRFTAPVYPGETLRTEMWLEPNAIAFRVRAVERNIVAINNGRIELRG